MDFKAETRAAQLISDNLQFFNLNKGKKQIKSLIIQIAAYYFISMTIDDLYWTAIDSFVRRLI